MSLPVGSTGILGLKKKSIFNGGYVAISPSWSISGNPSVYTFDLNLNTQEAVNLFSGSRLNLRTYRTQLEIQITSGAQITSTAILPVFLENDLNQGGEGTPQAIPDLKASEAEAVAGTNDAKWMTPLKVAQSIVSRMSPLSSAISALITGVSSVAGKTGAVTLNKSDVGLDNAVLHDANDVISVKGINSATPVTIEVDDATTAHQWVFSSDGHIDVETNGNQVGYLGTGFYADGQEIYLEKLDPSTGNVVAGNTVWFDTAHGNLTFAFPSSSGTIALTSDVSAAQSAAEAASVPLASKGVAGGVAGLDGGGKVPASQLPSYVDDVLEFSALSAFPATGETGKIYVTTGTNKTYRWSGSAYVEIASSPGSTDAVTEGSTNLYFTAARAIAAVGGTLASYATQAWVTAQGYATSVSVTSAISALVTGVSSVAGKTGTVTLVKGDVGLGSVDNTSDASKPVSTATQTALNGKANSSHTHAIADVTALQTALDAKLPLAGGTLTGNLTAPNVAVTGQVQFFSGGSMVAHQFYNSATNSIDTVFP